MRLKNKKSARNDHKSTNILRIWSKMRRNGRKLLEMVLKSEKTGKLRVKWRKYLRNERKCAKIRKLGSKVTITSAFHTFSYVSNSNKLIILTTLDLANKVDDIEAKQNSEKHSAQTVDSPVCLHISTSPNS